MRTDVTTVNNIRRRVAEDTLGQVQVWDLPVRVFHWALVLSIITAYTTHRLGVSYFTYHVWSGYAVIVLVSFRLIWGFIGTRHARFTQFVKGPRTISRYIAGLLRGEKHRHVGHNPLGAVMVVVLLAILGIQAMTGLFSNDEIFNVGPLYGFVGKELSLQLSSLHRKLFDWILIAVAIHVLAVLAHTTFKKEPLIRAMITGRKPYDWVMKMESIPSSRTWLAILVTVGLAAALALLIDNAPISSEDTVF